MQKNSLYTDYISEKNGLSSAQLYLKGIHCAACISKIETSLKSFTAIKSLAINLSDKKANIQWESKDLTLDAIISAVEKTGYQGIPYRSSKLEQIIQQEWKTQKQRFTVAAFCTIPVMLISLVLGLKLFGEIHSSLEIKLQYSAMFLTLPVLFYSGYSFIQSAWKNLKKASIGMDFQIAFSSLLMFFYSLYSLLFGDKVAYFEAVAMFITFILASQLLERTSLKKMSNISNLLSWDMPLFGRLIKKNKRETIPAHQIQVGMQLEVLPGEKAPADGNLLDKQASLDESSITGEYMPVVKKKKQNIYSGSLNLGAVFRYEVKKTSEESTMSKILKLMDNALQKKTHFQEKLNFFGKHFTNIIALLSISSFLIWYFILSSGWEQAALVAISVFIISCPCALIIATPLGFQVGLSKVAKYKGIFKSVQTFEMIPKIDTVIFDKTGSLTQGKPRVVQEFSKNLINKKILYSLVSGSIHPVAVALKNHLKQENPSINQIALDSRKEILGQGLLATIDIADQQAKKEILGGSLKFMIDNKVTVAKEWQNFIKEKYGTVFLFAVNKVAVALYFLEDSIREGADKLIEELKKKDCSIYLCSGDRKMPSLKLAKQLGISEDKVLFQQSPQNKLEAIQKLQKQSKFVLMLGDGWNDAPALAQADLSLSLVSGVDATLETADIILLTPDLSELLSLFKISSSTLKLVRQNIAISILYNIIALPLAIFGLVAPLVAALSMSFSSMLVVGNSFLHYHKKVK